MAKRMLTVATLLAAWLAPTSGHATGGTWCDVDDANLNFHFKAAQSRDGPGPWFGVEGRLETKFGKLPDHLAKFDIADENLTMRWLGLEGVLLQVQNYNADASEAVMLTVSTKTVEEATYEGTYELRVTADSGDEAYTIRTGKISCGAD